MFVPVICRHLERLNMNATYCDVVFFYVPICTKFDYHRVENAVTVEALQKFVQLTHSVDYFLEHMEVLCSLVEKHRFAEVPSCGLHFAVI